MITLSSALALVFAAAFVATGFLYARTKKYTAATLARYSCIIDLEAERVTLASANRRLHEDAVEFQRRATAEQDRLLQQYREAEAAFLANDNKSRTALAAEYQTALTRYQELQKEILVAEDPLEDISFGLYKPHFTFQTPVGI